MRRLIVPGVLILLLILGRPWSPAVAARRAGATCPQFAAGVVEGTIGASQLTETSGVVASRANPNVLWAHNDSGDSARVFAMNLQGQHLGIYNLSGATATDWEDIAIGPGPIAGQDYIYLSDSGDNGRVRTSVAVYRVPEPAVSSTQTPVTVDLIDWAKLPMQYPGSVYDAETLLVDPLTTDLFLVTRDRAGEGVARVFRNPAPHTAGVTVTLEQVATVTLPLEVKGGDVSPSGGAILLRLHSFSTQADGYYWARTSGTSLGDAFADSPCLVPLANETQGEALAFLADGNGYLTTSEGSGASIYYYYAIAKDPVHVFLPLIHRQAP